MKLISCVIVLCWGLVTEGAEYESTIQDLGGSDWSAVNQNQSIRVAAQVPGSIYSDLTRGGVLSGDIYDNSNDMDYRWVSYDNWTFERSFDVEEHVYGQEHIYLTAHGLDTIGTVTLNGHVLGPVEDMFVRYKWPVKQLLNRTANRLRVAFESAPLYGKARHEEHVKQGYPIPMICRDAAERGECHVNYVRKMQASFGWDWGPAFPTQGIWRPIQLEAFNSVLLRSVSVKTVPVDSRWHLKITAYLESEPHSNLTANLKVTLRDEVIVTRAAFVAHFNEEGETVVHVGVDVPSKLNIARWWPNGQGNPNLYPLTVGVYNEHSWEVAIKKTIKIGFRTVELSQEQLHPPKAGPNIINAYYFKVNGLPIFSKGANWIPAHVLYEAITKGYLYDLLRSCRDANMNMIRIWGGGFYEDDYFYEVADEMGLLVYQDMMFASSLYPADEHFLGLVGKEIRQQVRRLQYHPSIAVWCGNNENENNIARPYWEEIKPQYDRYKADYVALTVNVTMAVIEQEDGTRPFVSSSPSSGVADVRKGYIAKQDNRAGEVHHYILGGDAWNWHRYSHGKFISEYGFQSLSSVALLEKYINQSELVYPFSKAIDHRQHWHLSHGMVDMLEHQFHMPAGKGHKQLEDYVYIGQVFQAMSMKIESEFYRRNRHLADNGDGFTMGALYWQLNEIWPGFSWSSLEFGGKWKLMHYYVRNFFASPLVDVYEDDGHLKVVIVRDDHDSEKAEFQVDIKVFDWSKTEPIHEEFFRSATEPFAVTTVFNQPLEDYLTNAKCPGRKNCFIQVTIEDKSVHEKSRNFLLLSPIKDAIGLTKPKIEFKVNEGVSHLEYREFSIEIKTDHIAPFVVLDIDPHSGVRGTFSDNGFILAEKRVLFLESRNLDVNNTEWQKLITVRSLLDVHV